MSIHPPNSLHFNHLLCVILCAHNLFFTGGPGAPFKNSWQLKSKYKQFAKKEEAAAEYVDVDDDVYILYDNY